MEFGFLLNHGIQVYAIILIMEFCFIDVNDMVVRFQSCFFYYYYYYFI